MEGRGILVPERRGHGIVAETLERLTQPLDSKRQIRLAVYVLGAFAPLRDRIDPVEDRLRVAREPLAEESVAARQQLLELRAHERVSRPQVWSER